MNFMPKKKKLKHYQHCAGSSLALLVPYVPSCIGKADQMERGTNTKTKYLPSSGMSLVVGRE